MNKNNKIAMLVLLAPLAMFGMAFAGVPIYKAFCEATGYGGYVKKAKAPPNRDTKGEVEVSFDTNIDSKLDWTFKPEAQTIDVALGQNSLTYFKITNDSDKEVTGRAIYNVTPHKAAQYFAKLECFCFTDQTLAPHETRELPVVFYVDSRLKSDETTKDVGNITLSYTFVKSANQNVSALKEANKKTKS